jgi:cyanophycinase
MKIFKLISTTCLLSLFLLVPFLHSGQDTTKPGGSLVIIGGALQPENETVYQKFIDLGGGKDNIRIAIIPAASVNPVESGTSYIKDFQQYGVPDDHIKVFPVAVKDDPSTKEVNEAEWSKNAFKKELAEEMLNYTAVFFVGGDQARYLETLIDKEGNDSPLLTSIRQVYEKGGVIGGTSAGAAIMSDPMICGGNPLDAMIKGAVYQANACPTEGGAFLTKGPGFFAFGLVDQHFLKRGRCGRLIAALLQLKNVSLGMGVDEDTAAVYYSKTKTIEVTGSSGILLVDTRNAIPTHPQPGTKVQNIILHYLEEGDIYSIETGKFTIHPDRKKIETGKEYHKTYPLHTDIFGKDAITGIITAGLADNQQTESVGLAFTLEPDKKNNSYNSGKGVKLVFKKDKHTAGYWARIKGKSTYSVLHVHLDIIPITVKITE